MSCAMSQAGNCRFGAACKFSHELNPPTNAAPTNSTQRRPRRGELPCFAWNRCSCPKGNKCWYKHDPEVHLRLQAIREERAQAELRRKEAEAKAQAEREEQARKAEETKARRAAQQAEKRARRAEENARKAAEEIRAQQARETERLARLAEMAKADAAATLQHVVSSSIVTFSAGFNIENIITGFESCRIHIKGLPLDAQRNEICDLFKQQGIKDSHFHLIATRNMPDGTKEADVIVATEAGATLVVGLDDIEFRNNHLSFELGAYNGPGGMGSSSLKDTEILRISWRAPSCRYVAVYADMEQAREKAAILNNQIVQGRRVKVEVNQMPPGRYLSHFNPNSIKISNLPSNVLESTVHMFAHSCSIKRLGRAPPYDLQMATMHLHSTLRGSGGIKEITPLTEPDLSGTVTLRAHFTTWDDAKRAHDLLLGQRFAYIDNAAFWLHLPTPLMYTITIPSEQYKAQRKQWDSLLSSIKDRVACNLVVSAPDETRPVRIRVSGQVKQAVGALKVRVENLAAGQKVPGWHLSFGGFGNTTSTFLIEVHEETGAFVRADRLRHTLKVYGEAEAVEAAKSRIETEIQRLEGMEWCLTLKRKSIGHFVRKGVRTLNETYGDGTVSLDIASCKVTVRGGDEIRHALDRLIQESLSGLHTVSSSTTTQQQCPVCYDQVSSPHELGCGHAYCSPCLRHFLSNASETRKFPLVCIGAETTCGVAIPIPTVRKFLPPALFNHLLEVVFLDYVEKHPTELRYCKTPDCSQLYRCNQSRQGETVHCPSCFSSVCLSCHEEGHEGMTCREWQMRNSAEEHDRLNEAWMAQNRVKKCPQCGVGIEKTEGCNHMTCRRVLLSLCFNYFDENMQMWRTYLLEMGVFAADIIYQHLADVHGGYNDEEPVHQVDYQEQVEALRQAEALQQAGALRQAEALRQARALRQAEENRQRQQAAYGHLYDNDPFRLRQVELQRQQQVEEQAYEAACQREREGRLEQQRMRLEAWRREERERQVREAARRAEERQQGWGCSIM